MNGCGASANPFRAERVEALRYRLDAAGWQTLLDRLAALGHRGAIVGPCGSGKTTLLEELRDRCEARGLATAHWRPGREGRLEFARAFTGFLGAAPGRMLFLDGAEQLGWREWRRVKWAARAATGLVITSHRTGRLPTLRACGTTPRLLEELVHELLADAPHGGAVGAAECAALWRRHRGNLRDALRELYDDWAGRPVQAERPNFFSSSRRLSSMSVGRPCGQV
jgi:hypothetical protein